MWDLRILQMVWNIGYRFIGFGWDGVNFPQSILCSTLLLVVVGRVLILFWLLLSNTPTVSRLSFPNSHTIATRLGPGKNLGGHTAGTDNTNCPKVCLISYDFVLSNKSWGEREGRGAVFVVEAMFFKATATPTQTLLAQKSLDVTWWWEVEKKIMSCFASLHNLCFLCLNCLYLSPQIFCLIFSHCSVEVEEGKIHQPKLTHHIYLKSRSNLWSQNILQWQAFMPFADLGNLSN